MEGFLGLKIPVLPKFTPTPKFLEGTNPIPTGNFTPKRVENFSNP